MAGRQKSQRAGCTGSRSGRQAGVMISCRHGLPWPWTRSDQEVAGKRKPKTTARVKFREKSNRTVKSTEIMGIRSEIASVLVFTLAVFTYVSIHKGQGIPEDIQIIGFLGKYIKLALENLFGRGAFLIPIFLLAWSAHLGINKKSWSSQMWGVAVLFFTALMAEGLYQIPKGLTPLEAGVRGLGGGYLGGSLAYFVQKMVGHAGAVILLILGVLTGILLVVDKPVADITNVMMKGLKKLTALTSQLMFYDNEDKTRNHNVEASEPVIIHSPVEPPAAYEKSRDESPAGSNKAHLMVEAEPDVREEENFALRPAVKKTSRQDYEKPPLEMLSDITSERTIDKKNIKESISVLEDTFSSFGIKAKVNQVSCGPAVTRYEITPGAGVKISRIISLTDDLQLNLAAPGIRIEAPIPGKAAVGIEVPNRKILSVGLKSLLSSPAFKKLQTPLAFVLGEDISGNPVVSRMSDMPHLLIAGSTGSGKSVCLNCIIMSLLYNSTPDELKMVFIDPKMVELTVYNGIPHLMTPVVTDPKKASVILRWMVREMEKRYQAFAGSGARDIQRYNQVAQEKLPYIVIVIDELADLMMVAPVEVEDSICRLAQMARAAGMHLIVATQRPSVDVVTGVIKANIPSRIAFAVSSQADSRTILDSGGAEKLLGKGDMLFFPVGAVKPFRVQGGFVSDRDIEQTVNYIKEQQDGSIEEEQMQSMELSLSEVEQEEDDDLFWDAVRVFVESKKASVSLLQRRLRVGYARAARLVDIMEERGLISEADQSKKREILIDAEQLEKLYARNKLC